MVKPQQDHLQPIQDFLVWQSAQDTIRHGYRGSENPETADYIPTTSVQKYFKAQDRLKWTLRALFQDDDPPDAELIQDHYIVVLAILLSIHQGPMIVQFLERSANFEDRKLPFERHKDRFPQSSECDLPALFWNQQWKYCPVKMYRHMGNTMDEQSILPFRVEEHVGRGGSANVYRIRVDEGYNRLCYRPVENDSTHIKHNFILKTYRGREAKDYYEAERRGFMKLNSNGRPPHIIGYHGSFVQNGTYHIILEYADRGTLKSFIEQNDPPSDGEECIAFWTRLLRLNLGLHKIHNVSGDDAGGHLMTGYHQDLKPANILVLSGSSSSPYDCEFAIADLGLSHFKRVVHGQQSATDQDTHGTRAYGAPETFRIDDNMKSLNLAVKPAVDVWSLGCVFSECATWIGLGQRKVHEYRRQRQKEVAHKYKKDLGDLFHDGEKPLKAVNDNHLSIKRNCRREDFITAKVLDHIVVPMLSEEDYRLNARQLHGTALRVLDAARKDLEAHRGLSIAESPPDQSSEASTLFQPQPPPDSDSESSLETTSHQGLGPVDEKPLPVVDKKDKRAQTFIEHPRISVDEVVARRQQHKNYGLIPRLPNDYLLDDLRNRDHVFIVDNTTSMLAHKVELRKVLEATVYMVKRYDPDGVDMIFTKGGRKVKGTERTTKILKTFDKVEFTGLTDMQVRLGNRLSEYKETISAAKESKPSMLRSLIHGHKPPPLRRLSLYILTDGIWQPGSDVETPITSVVTKLKEHDLLDKQVGIQFIRFGNDPDAVRNLEYLDTQLKPKLGLDIVDTTSSDGNVWKMLLGGVNNWFDDDSVK